MADVKKLAPFIQRWEGGFVDDPDDLGGATNMGVTIATYKVYRKRKGLSEPTVDDLKHLSNNEWIDILKSLYWDKWKADQIKSQSVANILVDWVWASGIQTWLDATVSITSISKNNDKANLLTYYAASLDEYLHHKFQQPEGMAEVGIIGSGASEKPCKLIVSLVNIERETAGGISAGISRNSSDYMRTFAPLLLNLDLMLAAVYDEKRYAESLSVLYESLLFIQSHPYFELDGQKYTVEIVTLSAQDINNIWTTLGGQYYPSVMCKLRRLAVDAEEAVSSGGIAREPSVSVTK